MRKFNFYLIDIIEAMEKIEEFVNDLSFEEFQKDDKTYSAIIRKFEIIGEASKNIPDKIRNELSEIPWKEMAGMRDRLIHSYFGIDYKLVWITIKERIPKVKLLIKEALKQL